MHMIVISLAAILLGSTTTGALAACVSPPTDLVTPGKLLVGVKHGGPPVDYVDENGKLTGFDVEFARAVAGAMCLEPEFTTINQAGLIPALNAKKFDIAIGSLGISKERLGALDMFPYFLAGVYIVSAKASNLHFKNEYDLCGHTIAMIAGQTATTNLQRLSEEKCPSGKKIDIKMYPAATDTIQQVRKGVVEATIPAWTTGIEMVKQLPDLAIASPVLSGDPELPRNKAGIAIPKNEPEMAKALTDAIATVVGSPQYDALLDQFSLQDGDVRKAQ